MAFVDLHAHFLPGLDDGSRDPETTLAMVRGLHQQGFGRLCATPHQKAGQFLPTLSAIRTAFESTRTAVENADIPIELSLGAENMWDDVFFDRLQNQTIPSYDDGPSFLFELQLRALPIGLQDQLFELRVAGRIPVMAHPERYEALWNDDELTDELRENAAFVLDLGAVAGRHGRKRAKVARRWLKEGRAHAVTTDMHQLVDLKTTAEGIEWIRSKLGTQRLHMLLEHNPGRILAGEFPEEVP